MTQVSNYLKISRFDDEVFFFEKGHTQFCDKIPQFVTIHLERHTWVTQSNDSSAVLIGLIGRSVCTELPVEVLLGGDSYKTPSRRCKAVAWRRR